MTSSIVDCVNAVTDKNKDPTTAKLILRKLLI
jgi:hypothetical protein